jgi:hypothetical protein
MDPSVPNPGAANLPGAYVFGGTGPGRQGFTQFFDTHYKNFAPRIGFAYSITKNTVLRGGYGIFYKEYISQGVGLPQNGFSITPTFASADVGVTPGFYWDNGFPQGFNRPPSISPTVQNGQTAQIVQKSTGGQIPYSQQWNLTLERQITGSLMISGAYVANKGTHLYDQQQVNQVFPQYFSLGDSLLRANINSPAAQAAGIREPFTGFAQLFGSRATVAQALRPYPQFQNANIIAAPFANSTYNSFQMKVDQRFARGLSGTMAYTYSKFLSDGVGFTTANGGIVRQNAYYRDKMLYPTDQPHILTLSFSYQLPFGRGRRFSFSGARDKLFGGWAVGGVGAYSTGYPLAISTTNTLPIFNPSGLRPNLTGAPIRAAQSGDKFDPNRDAYLSRAAFANPGPLQYGNAPVYLNVRQPNLIQESFGVFKETRIFERLTNQFRLEMSNPMNRVVFGAPSIDLSTGNFGLISSQGNGARLIQLGMKLLW